MSLTPAKSRLERLPLEAKQTILSSLADITALQATASTCSSLYHAFKNAEHIIIKDVLLNQVHIDVLPEAIIAHVSRSNMEAEKFAAELQVQKLQWKFSEAFPLSTFSKVVDYFTADFAMRALASSPRQTVPSPSREEWNRIKRTFYRFEIYRNMFINMEPPHGSSSLANRGASHIFFQWFSPWENEQLACVYDYLSSVLAPIFNEIVEHDVAWGEYCVPLANDLDAGNLQALMYLGLEKLYEVMTADSYEIRYKLIYEKYPRSERFLSEGLANGSGSFSALKPFFVDGDSGPVDAFNWAHASEVTVFMQQRVNSRSRRYSRRWGYVMWDRKRLDAMRVLDTLWEKCWQDWKVSIPGHGACRKGSLKASRERRQLIYMAGGRGWWSESDESKVEWPNARSPWDGEDKRGGCPYCIGEVKCAPHRLVLRLDGLETKSHCHGLFGEPT